RHALPARCRELRRQLEESLERGVDVRTLVAGAKGEAQVSRLRVDGHHRRDPQAGDDVRHALADSEERFRDLVVDRFCERSCQLLLRRGQHEVHLGHEDLAPSDETLRCAPDERRLAVSARREDDDVLAVSHVGRQLCELPLAIGEPGVQGDVAEVEGVAVAGHCSRLARILATRKYATRSHASASAASRRPTAGANLKPCPEQAEPTTTRPLRSSTNCSSAVVVYRHVWAWTGLGSTSGKRSRTHAEMRSTIAGSGGESVSGSASAPAWCAPALSP